MQSVDWRPPVKTYMMGMDFKYIQPKRDGIFIRIDTQTGTPRAFTLRPTERTEQLKRLSLWKPTKNLPADCAVFGELWYPGQPASYVSTALANGDDGLRYEAFGYTWLNHSAAIPMMETAIEQINSWLLEFGFTVSPTFSYHGNNVAPHPGWLWNAFAATGEGGLFRDQLDYFGGFGSFEGFMLKSGNLSNWIRWKAERTIDLIVTGFEYGEGKYISACGALRLETIEGHPMGTVGGGMTDEMRFNVAISPSRYIGRVAEVKYQYIGAGGGMRHPRFVRFRDDKAPSGCTVSQDPVLERFYRNDSKC